MGEHGQPDSPVAGTVAQREPFERKPPRGYSWQPFEKGNGAAVKSGFWVSPALRAGDRVEVEEIMEALIEAMPFFGPGFALAVEMTAAKVWRLRRGYADLAEHGILRDGVPAPILGDLGKLERTIARDLDALGLTPRSAVALGVDLLRGEVAERSLADLTATGAEIRARRRDGDG